MPASTSNNNITQTSAKPETESKQWPLLTLREFTMYTVEVFRNGQAEENKSSVAEKYNAYCKDYEMIKLILDKLANYSSYNQDMCHQMMHTLLINLSNHNPLATLLSDIPSEITRYTTNSHRTTFTCNTSTSLTSPAPVTCLALATPQAHETLTAFYTKYNHEKMLEKCHWLVYLHRKEGRRNG